VVENPFNFMLLRRIPQRQRVSTLVLEPRLICLDDLPVTLVNAGFDSRLHLRLPLTGWTIGANIQIFVFLHLVGRWNNQRISAIISLASFWPVVAAGRANCGSN
jgi:hypothetical protein